LTRSRLAGQAERDLQHTQAANEHWQEETLKAKALVRRLRESMRMLRNYIVLRPRLRPLIADEVIADVDAAFAESAEAAR